MANREQLIILRQGSDIWNEWRQQNPSIEINLSYINLTGADLSYANFLYTNLTEANLSGANLSETDLTRAYLLGTKL